MVRTKKRFGQHFLNDMDIARRIAGLFGELPEDATLLEVGPGQGVMTEYLLDLYPEKLHLVELDWDLIKGLQQRFPKLRDRITQGDFLKMDLSQFTYPLYIIGNFPYNISSQIVFKGIENHDKVVGIGGMFQKEMAKRVTAEPGGKDHGVISVLAKANFTGEYLFEVAPEKFNPPPRVDSAVIRLLADKNAPSDYNPKLFKRIVKQAFLQRRKMLRNTLKSMEIEKYTALEKYLTLRPEQLSIADFIFITKTMTSDEA